MCVIAFELISLVWFGLYLPYHLASSSSAGETEAGFDFGGAFFLEKRATVLNVEGFDDLIAPPPILLKLRGFLSISDTPREAAAVEAANEAMLIGLSSNGAGAGLER